MRERSTTLVEGLHAFSVVQPEGAIQLVERDYALPTIARVPGSPAGEEPVLEDLDPLFQRLVDRDSARVAPYFQGAGFPSCS